MNFLGLQLSVTLLELLMLNALLAYSCYPVFNVGRMNMAFVAFSGIGGYCGAILVTREGFAPLPSILIGIVLSAAVSIPLGAILGRVRGVYLAIASVNLVAVFQVVLINLTSFTGGAQGISDLQTVVEPWMLVLAVAVVMFGFWALNRSRWGTGMRMQRTDELLALSSGVATNSNAALMFIAGAVVGALHGGLTAFWYGFVSPETYSFQAVILAVAMVVLGGRGEWLGPFVGAIFFTIIPEWLRDFGVFNRLVTGGILLFVVFYAPEGIMGWIRSRRGLRRARASAESRTRLRGSAQAPEAQPAGIGPGD